MIKIKPKIIVSADVCRDGGTYVVCFRDESNVFFELELPVILDHKSFTRIGYRQPILKNYETKEELTLSWSEAKEAHGLLNALLTESVDENDSARAREMFELLQLQGALPLDS